MIRLVLLMVSAILMLGTIDCSTPTSVTNTWRDPSTAAGPMRKILVSAARMDEAHRRTLEDAFVAAFAKRGVVAVPSYRAMAGRPLDRDASMAYLREEHFDGALVSGFFGVETTEKLTQTTSFDNVFGTWAGYVETRRIVHVETTLWDATNGTLVWSGLTETENPSSASDTAASLVEEVVTELTDTRLVAPSAARSR